jgi:hypothetical protein
VFHFFDGSLVSFASFAPLRETLIYRSQALVHNRLFTVALFPRALEFAFLGCFLRVLKLKHDPEGTQDEPNGAQNALRADPGITLLVVLCTKLTLACKRDRETCEPRESRTGHRAALHRQSKS